MIEELSEQTEVNVADLSVVPVIEEVFAIRLGRLQDPTINDVGGAERTLGRAHFDGATSEPGAVASSQSVKSMTFWHGTFDGLTATVTPLRGVPETTRVAVRMDRLRP